MRDDRLNELLNAELDGELDGAGQAELEGLLSASPEACARRDELRRVADALAHLKPVDPPTDFAASVFAALRPSSAKVVPFRGATPKAQRRWVPYLGALAAGAALGAIGLSIWLAPREGFDAASLAGTMTDPAHRAAGKVLDRVELQASGLTGSASLQEADGLWVVEFDLKSEAPVEVLAIYDGTLVRLQGFVRPQPTSEAVLAGPGRLSFVNEGAQRAAIYLRPADAAAGQVRLEFRAPGAPTSTAILEAGKGRKD